MNTNEHLFTVGLGLEAPWKITSIALDEKKTPHRLDIRIEADRGAPYPCPECQKLCKAHDFKDDTWRHLNFFQHHCHITAPVPRTDCPEHGTRRIIVPWARKGSQFTMFFEAQVLMLAQHMPVAALARFVGATDKRLWRIIHHHVSRAVGQLDLSSLKAIALDETASKKGHNYVTVFLDMERRSKPVIFVTQGKGKATLAAFAAHLRKQGGKPSRIVEVVCDMSSAFIAGVKEVLPNAFVTADWFHVVQLFTRALDEVRRDEARQVKHPKRLRFALLKNPADLNEEQRLALAELEMSNLATAEAWRCKEDLRWIREAESLQAAKWRLTNFVNYFGRRMLASVFAPMRKALATLAGYKDLILRRWESNYSNARLEGLNGVFKAARARARGYRNIETFKTMIYLIAAPIGDILNHFSKPFCPKTQPRTSA